MKYIKLIQYLLVLKTFFWVVLGVFSMFLTLFTIDHTKGYSISLLMMLNATITVILAYILGTKYKRSAFIIVNVFIWVNIILTFTDQFGIWDLLSLIIDTAIIISLYLNRRLFLKKYA